MGQLLPRAGSRRLIQSATNQWGRGFYTLQGGVDLGDLRFRPRVVGVVEMWKDFYSGNDIPSSPAAAEPRRYPDGQLSPRACSMSLSQSATSLLCWGFHTLRGGFGSGDLRFRPRIFGVVIWNDF